jgi:hypothetical protein
MAPNELSKESICQQQIAKRRPDKDNEPGFDRQQFMLINIDWRDVLVADECIKTHCRVSLPQHHATHGAGRASAPYRRALINVSRTTGRRQEPNALSGAKFYVGCHCITDIMTLRVMFRDKAPVAEVSSERNYVDQHRNRSPERGLNHGRLGRGILTMGEKINGKSPQQARSNP